MTDESIFADALAIADPEARRVSLDRACAGNLELRREVEELLAAHFGANPLDQGPAGLASTVVQKLAETTDPPDTAAGDRIGPYRLLEQIGEGGMGAVWMAEQTEPIRRRVALKVIKPGMDSRAVLARFEAERQALALMDHPNIAKVLDGGATSDGRPYFVMELVKGTPITAFCDGRRLTPKERLELFIPVCQAIQHAHTKGIIHRDIKPSNVLVELHDDRPVPKVIDFGIAKAVGQQLTENTFFTGFGAVVGTPAYMSPEQTSFNAIDIDTRSDVYSLGVLLYELLAGAPPFDPAELKRAAFDELLRIVREREPLKPSEKASSSEQRASIAAVRKMEPARLGNLLKGDLDWIVMKCLEKDRVRRYETANGLAADILRHLADEPVQAGPPSAGYRLRKFVKRNRGPVLAAAIILFVLLGGIVATTWAMLRAKDAEGRARGEEEKALRERDEKEKERDDKEKARAAEEEQRINAERGYASQMIDRVFAEADPADDRLTRLRKAEVYAQLPVSAREFRQFLIMNMLVHTPVEWNERVPSQSIHFASSPPRGVSLGIDGAIRFHQLPSGKIEREIRPESRRHFTKIEISTDGTTVIALSADNVGANFITLWTVGTGDKLGEYRDPRPAGEKRWSPDARFFVTQNFSGETSQLPGRSVGAYLWNARTGLLVRYYRDTWFYWESFSFAPDSRFAAFVAGRGFVEGPGFVQVIATADGEIVRRIQGNDGRFTPTGQHLVTFEADERFVADVVWHRTSDWEISGGSKIRDQHTLQTGFVFDSWVMFSNIIVFRRVGSSPRIVEGYTEANVIAYDDKRLLLDSGAMIEVDPYRFLPRPAYRKYHPGARQLSPDGRLLLVGVHNSNGAIEQKLIDLICEKELPANGWSYQLFAAGTSYVLASPPWSGQVSDPCVFFPAPVVEVDPDILRRWAQVLACGELNSAGKWVVRWDEAKWESERQQLARLAKQMEGFAFPGPVAVDRLHWIRTALDYRTDDGVGDRWKGMATDRELLDRLVAADPIYTNYVKRAMDSWQLGKDEWTGRERPANGQKAVQHYSESLDDWERALKCLGPNGSSAGRDGYFILHQLPLGMTRDLYLRFGKIFGFDRSRLKSTDKLEALLWLYRIEDYAAVIEYVARADVASLPTVAAALAATASPSMIIHLLAYKDKSPAPSEWLALAAMSHWQRGEKEWAQRIREQLPDAILSSIVAEAKYLIPPSEPKKN